MVVDVNFQKISNLVKNMTRTEELEKEIIEKDAVIKFLKKELQHKSSFKNAMKKQYRELKDKLNTLDKYKRENRNMKNQLLKLYTPENVDEIIRGSDAD